jgi:Tol biopolymer transport system component
LARCLVAVGFVLLVFGAGALAAKPKTKPVVIKSFQLYVVRPDGSKLAPLGKLGRLHPSLVRWSPDGQHVAFAADNPGISWLGGSAQPDLLVIDANGKHLHSLTAGAFKNGPVAAWAWSPDSTTVAYIQDTFPESGSEAMAAYFGPTLITAPGEDQSVGAVAFSWSPDGRSVAYSDIVAQPPSTATLAGTRLVVAAQNWLEHGSGAGPRVVTGVPAPYRWLTDPAWSADGGHLAFSAAPNSDDQGHVFVVNTDGTQLVDVTGVTPPGSAPPASTPTVGYAPVWSPKGGRLAFVGKDVYANTDAYAVNADGSGLVLLGNIAPRSVPLWSPDGRRLALTDDGSVEIRNADASGRTIYLGVGARSSSPAWSPDGKRLALVRFPLKGRPRIVTISPAGTGLHTVALLPAGTSSATIDWSSRNVLVFSAWHGAHG